MDADPAAAGRGPVRTGRAAAGRTRPADGAANATARIARLAAAHDPRPGGTLVTKRAYAKPRLKRLGLLRRLTRFTGPVFGGPFINGPPTLPLPNGFTPPPFRR